MNLLQSAEPLPERLVIDASAGTGKTWSVVALIARELALREDLRIGNLLITTFTRNAAAELRDRLRKRLAATSQSLKASVVHDTDPLNLFLRDVAEQERASRVLRLERALSEFDSASISTIHGICSRILRAAGREISDISEASATQQIISEVVNDLLVANASRASRWDEQRIIQLVSELLGDPYLEPWFDQTAASMNPEEFGLLAELAGLLRNAVRRIQEAMKDAPDYNDILRLAWKLVRDPGQAAVLNGLRQRFRLAVVDEAQDTNRLQWELFEQLFPGGDGRSLVSVGDPKQAIYGFRGADVRSYVQFTQTAASRLTLDINRRSDQPLLNGLNTAMFEREFGAGIRYHAVNAPPERQLSRILGTQGPLELIGLGEANNQSKLVRPAVGKVLQLLDQARIESPAGLDSTARRERPVEPSDICVLVRSNGVGRLIQRGLSRGGVPSVTGGTSSVMRSTMALQTRTLLEAMERPASTGRIRRVAATVFFGHPMTSVGTLADEAIESIQARLMSYSGVLTKKGIAALSTAIESDESVMIRMVSGKQGERNLTDFMHLLEVMDSHCPGRGCTAKRALELYAQLDQLDDKDELVSRRVESDADAVRILTIHAAKGLQFPCVLVADLWKEANGRGNAQVFYDDDGTRKIDIGRALRTADGDAGSSYSEARRIAAQNEELKRLIYVAVTRPEHWLGILVPEEEGQTNFNNLLAQTMFLPETLPPQTEVPSQLQRQFRGGQVDGDPETLQIAELPAVRKTWQRQSFTGIAASLRGSWHEAGRDDSSGNDELGANRTSLELEEAESGAALSEVIELPAGAAVGTAIHEIFERVDTMATPLRDEVARVVRERVTGGRFRQHHDGLVRMVTETLETPLGAHLDNLTLREISPADRLCELRFEMGIMGLSEGLKASDFGRKLQELLRPEDKLFQYAKSLAAPTFDVPLGGLLNGSIDAVLRLPGSSPVCPRLLIVDYKSNKLHREGDPNPIAAYAPDRLLEAMVDHHYPLQALLYGTALARMLRWRVPGADIDECLLGFTYGFIRGMRGSSTPIDREGNRYGVFAWRAPKGFWGGLSRFLAAAERKEAPV